MVQFVNGPLKYELDATIRDNYIAVVEDKGTIPVGNYAIVVLCKDDNGDPRRFKQRCVLEVVDVTADAGIEVGIEFEAQEWLLDGAIFLAIKGEDGIDGVGIESITTDETSVSGEYNQVTFHLTNGSSYTLNVRNGESTEQTLPANVVVDENYVHTDNNYTDTDKQKVESVDKLFADAEYDRISRRLNFFKYGDTMHTNPLKSIDITDFIRDSRVSSFRIIDGNLTIRLNSDGNNEEFKVPITSIFNPNNYYTKEQVEDLLDSGFMAKEDFVYEGSVNLKYGSAPEIVLSHIEGVSMYQEDHSRLFGASNGHIKGYVGAVGGELFDYGLAPLGLVFLDKTSGLFYRWNVTAWQQVGGSGSGGYEPPVGGIPKSDLAQSVQTSLGKADTALQSSDLEGYATTDDVDDAVAALVSTAPHTLNTLKELADALGDDPNFATTMATQLGNKVDKETGKGLSTNDYTTAEKTKLAGLENYDDSALQTAIDGKVDKESGKSLMTDAERTKLQGIAAGAEVNVQANWTQTNTSADDYIKNKPTIPAAQVNSDWNASTGKAAILNKPTIPVGIANATTSEDGTWTMTLSNGEYITVDLNHVHPQYLDVDDIDDYIVAGSNVTITKDSQTGVLEISASGASGSQVQANWNESDSTSAAYIQNKPTIPTVPTNVSSFTNDAGYLTSHQSLSGRVQSSDVTTIVVLADEAAYTALTTKDSSTLYLIPEA